MMTSVEVRQPSNVFQSSIANFRNAVSSKRCTVHSSIGKAPMLRYTFKAVWFQSRQIHSIRPQFRSTAILAKYFSKAFP